MIPWWIAPIYSLSLFGDDDVREIRDKMGWALLSKLKIPRDDVWESLHTLRIRESAQLKNRIGIERHGHATKDIDALLSEIENNGEKECRSENSITKLWRQARENWIGSSDKESKGINWRWREGKGICHPWKEKGQCSQGDKCSLRHGNPRSCTKTRTHCRHAFWANRVTRSKCVEEERSIRGKSNHGSILRPVADIIWEVFVRERLVDILASSRPSANSTKMKRVVRLETSVCFRITRLMNKPNKKPEKELPFQKRNESDDKNAPAVV